jgi:hypothetical protein
MNDITPESRQELAKQFETIAAKYRGKADYIRVESVETFARILREGEPFEPHWTLRVNVRMQHLAMDRRIAAEREARGWAIDREIAAIYRADADMGEECAKTIMDLGLEYIEADHA